MPISLIFKEFLSDDGNSTLRQTAVSSIHHGTVCQAPSGAGTLAHRRSAGKAVCGSDVPPFRQSKRKTSRQSSPAAKVSIANAVGAGVRRPPPLLRQWSPPWRSVTPTGPRGGAHGRDQSLLRCTSSGACAPAPESERWTRGRTTREAKRGLGRTALAIEPLIRPCRAVAANAAGAPAGHRTSGSQAWQSAIGSSGSHPEGSRWGSLPVQTRRADRPRGSRGTGFPVEAVADANRALHCGSTQMAAERLRPPGMRPVAATSTSPAG